MTKHVSLSANENPLYLFYLPLTCWAWNKFGWKPIVIFVKEKMRSKNEVVLMYVQKSISCNIIEVHLDASEFVEAGYNTATIAQLSRLYAAISINDGDYLMTGDADMVPLSDYWHIENNEIYCPKIWGWDLTENQHIPICYIGMTKSTWLKTMNIDGNYKGVWIQFITDDLRRLPNAKSDDPVKKWVVDQDLITERIKKEWFPLKLWRKHRGIYPNGYPIGRVDRSAWSHNHEQYIDCHAPHDILTSQESRNKLLHLLKFIWPNEDFTWWENYQNEFLELLIKTP